MALVELLLTPAARRTSARRGWSSSPPPAGPASTTSWSTSCASRSARRARAPSGCTPGTRPTTPGRVTVQRRPRPADRHGHRPRPGGRTRPRRPRRGPARRRRRRRRRRPRRSTRWSTPTSRSPSSPAWSTTSHVEPRPGRHRRDDALAAAGRRPCAPAARAAAAASRWPAPRRPRPLQPVRYAPRRPVRRVVRRVRTPAGRSTVGRARAGPAARPAGAGRAPSGPGGRMSALDPRRQARTSPPSPAATS